MALISRGKEAKENLSVLSFSKSTHSNNLGCLSLHIKEKFHVVCGYGQCSKYACQAYQGNDQVCGNCGHSYQAHY